MKYLNYMLIVSICLICGCSFTRELKVILEGANAQKYGNVDEVLLQNNWEIRIFQRCR